MTFSVEPKISACADLKTFWSDWQIGEGDLVITSQSFVDSQLQGMKLTCDILCRNPYGSGEPTDVMIDAMMADCPDKEYRRIIAIGGGTIIDIAKLFVFGSGLNCEKIFAEGATLPRKRSLIIVPTTCGTGSEVTNISIVALTALNTKKGLAVPALYADEAVLIGSLLKSMPYQVFATSSIDALIHAVESFLSPKHTSFSRAMGRTAIEMILRGYQAVAAEGKRQVPADLQDFLEASTMAGIAFGNAGCAAVHALSYPIGATYHVPHGESNFLVFAAVFAMYQQKQVDFTPLAKVLCPIFDCQPQDALAQMFALVEQILPSYPLSKLGITPEICREMAASAIANQQRLLANNPVILSEEEICSIYLSCL